MKQNMWDAANGTAAVGFVASVVAGWDWPTIAAQLAAFYTLILIGEKILRAYWRWQDRKKADG